jgi:hypothetical protein
VTDNNLIDLTSEESETTITTTTPSTQQTIAKKGGKIYKKAKSLKRRIKKLESQRRGQYEEEMQLMQQHKDNRDKANALETGKDVLEQKSNMDQLELEHFRLEVVRLRNTKQSLSRELDLERSRATVAEHFSEKLAKSYKQEVEKARASSLAEVKVMLESYPKLTEENRTLTFQNQKIIKQLKDAAGDGTSNQQSSKHTSQLHMAKDLRSQLQFRVAKALRERQRGTHSSEPSLGGENQRQKTTKTTDQSVKAESIKMTDGKYSAQAVRMTAASHKVTARKSVGECLGAASSTAPPNSRARLETSGEQIKKRSSPQAGSRVPTSLVLTKQDGSWRRPSKVDTRVQYSSHR